MSHLCLSGVIHCTIYPGTFLAPSLPQTRATKSAKRMVLAVLLLAVVIEWETFPWPHYLEQPVHKSNALWIVCSAISLCLALSHVESQHPPPPPPSLPGTRLSNVSANHIAGLLCLLLALVGTYWHVAIYANCTVLHFARHEREFMRRDVLRTLERVRFPAACQIGFGAKSATTEAANSFRANINATFYQLRIFYASI